MFEAFLILTAVVDHIDHSILVLFRRNRLLRRMVRRWERLGRSSLIEVLRGFADSGLGHCRIVGYLIGMKVFLRGDMRMTSCLVGSCCVWFDAFV